MKKFLILLFILPFISCNILTLENDDAESKPGMSVSWFDGEYVNFLFSCDVLHYYAEESVILKSGKSQFTTEKLWFGNMLLIKPRDGWVKGRKYQASLNGTMYKPSGSLFTVYAASSFTYGEMENTFYPVSIPVNQTNCDRDYTFTFVFNKEISKVDFEECFSIAPSVEYKIEADSTKRIFTVHPKEKWSVNTFYAWKIENLTSMDNWELQDSLNGSFETKADHDCPVLEKICPVSDESSSAIWFENKPIDGNLIGKMPIGFIFSKPMKFESVKDAISITPSIDGYYLQADNDGKKFLFVPEKFYQLKKKYVVKVSTTAKDKNDLVLYQAVTDSFTSADDYLELTALKLDTEEISDWSVSPIIHSISNNSMTIMLSFSKPFSEEKLYSVTNAIALSLLFPLSSKSPIKTEALWNVRRNVLTLSYTNITIRASDQTTYYQLKLTGGESGINTGEGHYLKENICINIQPE